MYREAFDKQHFSSIAKQSLLDSAGLRPWSSDSIYYGKYGSLDFRNHPHAYQDGRSDEASFEALGSEFTSEDKDESVPDIASNRNTASIEVCATIFGGNSGVDLEVACIEGPELAGIETKISDFGNVSRKGDGVSVLRSFGEDKSVWLHAFCANADPQTASRIG